MVKVQFFPQIVPDQDFQMGAFLLMLGKNQTLCIHKEELIPLSQVCSQIVLFRPCTRRSFFFVAEVDGRQAGQVERRSGAGQELPPAGAATAATAAATEVETTPAASRS